MRIIRYINDRGNIEMAKEHVDGSHLVIEGDIYSEFTVTNRLAKVSKHLAPISPTAIIGIGLNYKFHAEETNSPIPQYPIMFMKLPSSIQNPDDPIELPGQLKSTKVDYECELAVVIGKTAKNINRKNALEYVLGYTCANDVSARDWQKHAGGGQWCRSKTFDTFCPLGPALVTADDILNPNSLGIKTILNDQTMQDWNTNDMIFDVPSIIEFLSASTTLLPGTVILTGTPQGVGMAQQPPVWLKAGDVVSIEIEGIGRLTNPVTNENL
jgi:2-keto-4-pentenoate hydratase/2-oxohepta-3-ene-1,7-dioic acid hydratase in catechol pathway